MISTALLDGVFTFASSSGVTTTYFPLVYSYPFTISFQGTTSPSVGQTRSYLIGVRSSLCSWRKLVFSAARTALARETGMFTSPKVRAPVHMDAMTRDKAGG